MVGSPRGFQGVEVAHIAVGLHRSRRQAVDADMLPGVVEGHGLCELDQRALGGAVPGPPWPCDAPELGGDQNDTAATSSIHGRNRVLESRNALSRLTAI